MILSRAVQRLGRTGWLAPARAKKIARWVAHLEHAGGGVVGIEFLAPHYFSAFALMTFAALFVLVRLWAGAEESIA